MSEQTNPAEAKVPEEKSLATISSRFVSMVEKQFAAEMGSALAFTDYEKTLAQHMMLKVDAALKTLEEKRQADGKEVAPYTWTNINMTQMALDTVHRIGLGLDALIPNHIHPIPYWSKKLQKYNLDLRIGYTGKDYSRRKMAVEEPLDVIYELVFDTDIFKPIMRGRGVEIESYEFELTAPFKRGIPVGGFGYIIYADPRKNRLVIVSERDFGKAENVSKSQDFWGEKKFRHEMMMKTIVHRVTDKIPLDPTKVNAKSYAYVEAQEKDSEVQREIDDHASEEIMDAEVISQTAPEPKPDF